MSELGIVMVCNAELEQNSWSSIVDVYHNENNQSNESPIDVNV